jgi:phage terminase Nu1 subunit (DNA packaging protein)
VNKEELAAALKISLPTLTKWITNDPEFPIVDRGSKGIAWQFDLGDVRSHLARKKVAAKGSLDDQIKTERLQAMRLAAAEKAGGLVSLAQLQDLLAGLFASLSADLSAFVAQLAREQAWPAVVRSAAQRRLVEMQRAFVAKAPDLLEAIDLPAVTLGDDGASPAAANG